MIFILNSGRHAFYLMVWKELIDDTKQHRPESVWVLILGAQSHSLRPQTDIVGFKSQIYEKGGRIRAKVLLYAVDLPDPRLVEPLKETENACVILCLDWLDDTQKWPKKLESSMALAKTLPSPRLVISAANFDKVQQQMASATFDEDVETHQAFLRSIAIEYGAALVYDHPGFDWLALVAGEPLEPRITDDFIVIPAGWDTKERILTSVPHYDYNGILPKLRIGGPVLPDIMPKRNVTETDFSEVIKNATSSVPKQAPLELSPDVDDRDALGGFFEYLIDRANS